MRCKLIKEYAQLIRDDPLYIEFEEWPLKTLLDAILIWNADELKANIEMYKNTIEKNNQ